MLEPTVKNVKLNEILQRYRKLIINSEDGSWSGMSKSEILMDIDITIDALNNGKISKGDFLYLTIPTGHMQDFAIDNGWGEQYNEFATELEMILNA